MSGDAKFLLRPQTGGEDFPLQGEVLVGRKDDCDLVVSEGHPSRHHARLVVDADGVLLVDLGSANGTFVNGRKIEGEQRLMSGDRVAFDAATYVFIGPGEALPDGATVVRSVEELDRTVIRSAADLQKELEAVAQPAKPAVTEAPVGSWADPEKKANPAGTQIISRDELAKMVGEYAAAESASDAPHLQIGTGPDAGSIVQLQVGEGASEWSIGSDAARDIVLRGDGVSSYHAKIVHDSGRWKLVDQMSANGSFINNDKVVTAFLNPNDRIKLGTVEFAIVFPGKGGKASSGTKPSGKKSGGSAAVGIAVFAGVLVMLGLAYYFLF